MTSSSTVNPKLPKDFLWGFATGRYRLSVEMQDYADLNLLPFLPRSSIISQRVTKLKGPRMSTEEVDLSGTNSPANLVKPSMDEMGM